MPLSFSTRCLFFPFLLLLCLSILAVAMAREELEMMTYVEQYLNKADNEILKLKEQVEKLAQEKRK